jgi:hypothetical protein
MVFEILNLHLRYYKGFEKIDEKFIISLKYLNMHIVFMIGFK